MIELRTQSMFKRSYPDGLKTYKLNDDQLHELQETLRIIARDVIEVIESNRLQYILYAGSALGAVRHHDFIPWDDDLDIAMPREDLEKFIGLFDKELGSRYWLSTPGITSGCRAPMTKVLLKDSILKDRNTHHTKECGVSIDIFPYETVPDNRILREVFRIHSLAAGLAASCRWFYEDRSMYRAYVGTDKDALSVINIKIRIGWLLSFRSLDYWVSKAYRVWSKYSGTDNRMIAVIARWNETLAMRQDVFPAIKMRFGKEDWCVPAKYDDAMKAFFGDYMKLPPEEDRESHGFFDAKLPGWAQSISEQIESSSYDQNSHVDSETKHNA